MVPSTLKPRFSANIAANGRIAATTGPFGDAPLLVLFGNRLQSVLCLGGCRGRAASVVLS